MAMPSGMPGGPTDEPAPTRVRVTVRSAALIVGSVALSVFLLRVLRSAERVIGWIAFAAALAVLLDPLVSSLQRWIPRGFAMLVVMLTLIAGVGLSVYAVVDDVATQTERLEEVLPREARQLERESRFREQFQQFELARRTREAVRSIPRVLQGGSPEEAVRSAADRGAGALASLILTLFFLGYGRRGLTTVLAQVPDPQRRSRLRAMVVETYRRASRYALGTSLLAVITGLVAFTLAHVLEIPGPAALGVWAGLWSLVPLFGPLVGSLPLIGLATVQSAGETAVAVLVLLAFHVGKDLALRRRLERTTVRVGPFLTAFAAVIGLELYGLGGALVWMLAAVIVLAAADVVGEARHPVMDDVRAAAAALAPNPQEPEPPDVTTGAAAPE